MSNIIKVVQLQIDREINQSEERMVLMFDSGSESILNIPSQKIINITSLSSAELIIYNNFKQLCNNKIN